ncbi:hypothetical protein MHYP_G00093600 [Metynnis hypsauchen]
MIVIITKNELELQWWGQHLEDKLKRCCVERGAVHGLQDEAERALESQRGKRGQYGRVNTTLIAHSSQTTYTRNALQQQLSKVYIERDVRDRKKHRPAGGSIEGEADPALSGAETAARESAKRPRVELCCNPPHTGLLAEVRCIQDTMCVLRQRVCEAHALLQTPAQNKSVLEEEQQSKAQALHIDQHSCTELHKTYINILQLLGHTQLRDTLT